MALMGLRDFAQAICKLMEEDDPGCYKGCALDTLYEAVKARLHAPKAVDVGKDV